MRIMKKILSLAVMLTAGLYIYSNAAHAALEIGQPAPEFQAVDVNGNMFNLNDYKGKVVVLEWTNHECPFVIKHYDTGNMQKTQKEVRAMGDVEWIKIVSSAPGKQGHLNPEKAKAVEADAGTDITTKILDESGEIGRLFDAKTTPHMFIVDASGNLAYAGAIDDNSSPRASTVDGAKNYVLAAVQSLANGEKIEVTSSNPYGCSVKY